MLTAKEQVSNIGKEVQYPINGLIIPCRVVDVKMAFNILKFQIKPIHGQGEIWINAETVIATYPFSEATK